MNLVWLFDSPRDFLRDNISGYPVIAVSCWQKGRELRIFLGISDREERLALQFLLDHEPGLEVIGIAIRSDILLAQVGASQPDVILIDWNLVTEPAADILSDLRSLAPGLKIVVLHVHPEIKRAAESAGADVFISKDSPPDELIMILREMREDELADLH